MSIKGFVIYVHHGLFGDGPSLLEGFPAKILDHCGLTTDGLVISSYKSCSPPNIPGI